MSEHLRHFPNCPFLGNQLQGTSRYTASNLSMQTYAARIKTFCSWPSSVPVHPEQLASAGFYYVGKKLNLIIKKNIQHVYLIHFSGRIIWIHKFWSKFNFRSQWWCEMLLLWWWTEVLGIWRWSMGGTCQVVSTVIIFRFSMHMCVRWVLCV